MYDREWSVFMMGSSHILYDGSGHVTGSGQCV